MTLYENFVADPANTRKSSAFRAAVSAMICGVVAHAFALVNVLHNYDNILQLPKGYGAGITSGRWLLALLGDFFQNVLDLGYNLPVLKGLAYLALIALSAAVVVDLLRITGGRAVLTGCLMATFPTVFDTMAFRYTAPYYGLALLLSVLAAWTAQRKRWGLPVSVLCLACSMGIYQAYPPVTISLFLLCLMGEALEEDADIRKLVRKGLRYCVTLVLGVALYFVLLKIMIALYSIKKPVALDSYQGISTMGKIPLSILPWLIKRAWFTGATFTLTDYCGLSATPVFKVIWTLMVLAILALAVCILVRKKIKPVVAVFFCLMGLLFPLGVNFIMVMCPDALIYAIMVYAFVLVAVAPLMLLEYLPRGGRVRLARIIGILAACIVFYNSYYGNLNDTELYYADRQVENYFSGMFAQIRMTEGYTPDKRFVFLGEEIHDPRMWNIWNAEPSYGGFAAAEGMLNANYSVDFWIINYLGYATDDASDEEKNTLWQDPRVKDMPCWPSEGSIGVVDDYLVVKYQEAPNAVP